MCLLSLYKNECIHLLKIAKMHVCVYVCVCVSLMKWQSFINNNEVHSTISRVFKRYMSEMAFIQNSPFTLPSSSHLIFPSLSLSLAHPPFSSLFRSLFWVIEVISHLCGWWMGWAFPRCPSTPHSLIKENIPWLPIFPHAWQPIILSTTWLGPYYAQI